MEDDLLHACGVDITPGVSLGPVRLGEGRTEHLHRIGEPSSVFRRSPAARPCSEYRDLGLFLYYDEDDQLEFAESFIVDVRLDGVVLSGRPLIDVERDLAKLGRTVELDDVGATSPGFGLYAPFGNVESVGLKRV